MKNLKFFINWLLPYRCLTCNREVDKNSILCPKCFSGIVFIDYPICRRCGRMFEAPLGIRPFLKFEDDDTLEVCESCQKHEIHFDIARAIFQYNNLSKRVIMSVKKQADNHTAMACAKMIFSRYQSVFDENVDFVVPVPSHWTRLLRRGFNPANIIAMELSKVSNLKYLNIMRRNKKTDYQKNKSMIERLDNVENAFSCATNLDGKNIVVVDDVLTTGATLNECAKILKAAGAKYVACITIANTRKQLLSKPPSK